MWKSHVYTNGKIFYSCHHLKSHKKAKIKKKVVWAYKNTQVRSFAVMSEVEKRERESGRKMMSNA